MAGGLRTSLLDHTHPEITMAIGVAQHVAPSDNPLMPMPVTPPPTLTIDAARRDALDTIARETHRDRDAVLAEAIDSYIAVQRWQVEHIAEGLRQAEAGEFANDEEVEAAFARWR